MRFHAVLQLIQNNFIIFYVIYLKYLLYPYHDAKEILVICSQYIVKFFDICQLYIYC